MLQIVSKSNRYFLFFEYRNKRRYFFIVRYKLSQAKKKIKNSKQPWIIIISGVPNTGKSTVAVKLASKLDWSVCVGVDQIKEIIKKYDRNPYLKKSSHDGWELIGKRTIRNILLGYQRYCKGLEAGMMQIIERSKVTGENIILEGVQLLPNFYKNIHGFNKIYILIKSNFDKKHYKKIIKKIEQRHKIQADVWSKRDSELKLIQNYLIRKSNTIDYCILEQADGKNLIEKIINIIANYEAK